MQPTTFRGSVMASVLMMLALGASIANRPVWADEPAEPHFITKIYPVGDLLLPLSSHAGPERPQPGSGAPMFAVPDNTSTILTPHSYRYGDRLSTEHQRDQAAQTDELIDLITETLGLSSWSQVGGTATIKPFHRSLVICQTAEVHAEIKKLLDQLRADIVAMNSITVRAWWFMLDTDEHRKLMSEMPETSPPLVNVKELSVLAEKPDAFRGEVTCLDGQPVHVQSGHFQTALVSLESREQSELMEMHFNPIIERRRSGALLEVLPTRDPEGRWVMLDLISTYNRMTAPEKPIEFKGIALLDRPTGITHRLATTVKMPLKKPVLVGGLTLEPEVISDTPGKKLYLIVEVIDDPLPAKK